MLPFLAWYFTVSLLGFFTFPLTYHLLPSLADRGYALARILGLLLWGYLFWILASLGIAQNDLGGLFLALSIVLALSAWALWKECRPASPLPRWPVVTWMRENRRLIYRVEGIFFLAFAFLAFARASEPALVGTEKPMEVMFINGILRSPTFPPRDPWLSGYAISYYYFGYVLAAMLAKVSGVSGAVAHNLMTSLIFGLSAVGAYGLVYDTLAAHRRHRAAVEGKQNDATYTVSLNLPLLGPLFLLLVSNLEAFLEILHRRGLFWRFTSTGQPSSFFWAWLDIKDLRDPPMQPLGWLPERYWWWWRASRVIMDYDLAGNWKEIINEFPAFSFLLGDLHPHVLAIPFGLLAIGLALNLFLGGWQGGMRLFDLHLPIQSRGFLCLALTLGGLAFLNTWDILPYLALALLAFMFWQVRQKGWGWNRLGEAMALGLPLFVTSVLLYLPFYLGFSSQLGGVLPNLIYPTRGAHLAVMFAPLLLPIFSYLAYLPRGEGQTAAWRQGILLLVGLTILLWGLSWLLAVLISWTNSEVALAFLREQGFSTIAELFKSANLRRLEHVGSWLILGALLTPVLAFLGRYTKEEGEGNATDQALSLSITPFILLMVLVGGLLVLGVEFFYLRDLFGNRMNTVFKFYFQSWILWSLAAAFSVAVMISALRGLGGALYRVAITLLLLASLTYPVLAFPTKTANFQWRRFQAALTLARQDGDWSRLRGIWTLDGAAYLEDSAPAVVAAIRWLRTAPDGILVEAGGGSYQDQYARVSTYTGLPTVLGWKGHEDQWRGASVPELEQRFQDVWRLYETTSWEEANAIIRRYNIRYICVGPAERAAYRVREQKFQDMLRPVFQAGEMTIYEVP